MTPRPALPSLRLRMLWQLMLPLALTWLLGSAVALAVAAVYIGRALDRALLDDAYTISANVALHAGELTFNLTPQEAASVLFDRDEHGFFAVLRPDGSLLAGEPGLRPAAMAEPWAFEDLRHDGLALRAVTLMRPSSPSHTVVVAQTTRSRDRFVRQLLLASIAPQALLLGVLGAWLRRSIERELQPLAELETALARRDTSDLTPVHLRPQSHDIALLATAFNALMARIAAGVQAQREFAGNVAHELRTPLARIRSLAEYGLAHDDAGVRAEQLRRIVASEQRASRLVDQLLALAFADEARQSLKLEPLRLDLLVQDLLLRWLPRADALGVDLGAAGLEREVWVQGNASLVEGLLSNLVDNALRHGRPTRPPGAAPCVTVELAEHGDAVLLSVSDNGPGVDTAQRERVLARWERGAAGPPRGEGAGLGLGIVARYAELLGGRLELGSASADGGLCAALRLQRAAATMAAPS